MTTTTQPRTRRLPAWAIVAKREVMAQLTDKTFWISTLTTIALMAVVFGLSFLFGGGGSATKIGVDSDEAANVLTVANSQGQNLEPVRMDSADLEAAVLNDDVNAALTNSGEGWALLQKPAMTSGDYGLPQAVRAYQVDQNATALGVDPAELMVNTELTMQAVGATNEALPAVMITTFAFAFLFMFAAMSYGYMIAQSVVTEKESRIVEILAATIPIRQLLIGKVVGNTLLALGQVILFVTIALVGLSFTDYRSLVGLIAPVAGWFILFFLVGFASLACLWAAAGAMATRMQDLGQTTTPLMMIIMGVYMAGFLATGTLATALSYVPIASTVLMPGRLLRGEATWVDALLALAAAVAFMALAIWAGSRVYRRGLLQTGQVITLSGLFKKAA